MKRAREELEQIGPWTVRGVLGWSAQATVYLVEHTRAEGAQRVGLWPAAIRAQPLLAHVAAS